MASREKKIKAMTRLAKHWPKLADKDLQDDYMLVFESLTDHQVDAALNRIRHEHPTSYPPTPAQFYSYGGGKVHRTAEPMDMARVAFKEDGAGRLFVESINEQPLPRGFKIPVAEHNRRMSQLKTHMGSGARPILTEQEARELHHTREPNSPEILAIRNKLRRALGWPLLDERGREIHA